MKLRCLLDDFFDVPRGVKGGNDDAGPARDRFQRLAHSFSPPNSVKWNHWSGYSPYELLHVRPAASGADHRTRPLPRARVRDSAGREDELEPAASVEHARRPSDNGNATAHGERRVTRGERDLASEHCVRPPRFSVSPVDREARRTRLAREPRTAREKTSRWDGRRCPPWLRRSSKNSVTPRDGWSSATVWILNPSDAQTSARHFPRTDVRAGDRRTRRSAGNSSVSGVDSGCSRIGLSARPAACTEAGEKSICSCRNWRIHALAVRRVSGPSSSPVIARLMFRSTFRRDRARTRYWIRENIGVICSESLAGRRPGQTSHRVYTREKADHAGDDEAGRGEKKNGRGDRI